MGMENTERLGDFGSDQTDLNLTLGAGRASQLINDTREKAERRRRKKRGVGGLIGGAIGAVAGGFAGDPLTGWQLGSAAGGSF